ncbi:MAG: hypothetical protein LBR97_10650 [Dysgonamonadaceae bacterium]|nr:hypothetical protein [Dysgonamonadaceae bacterium]
MGNKKNIWQFPWRYKESIVITAGIILIGFALQFTIGAFDFTLLRRPVNFILGGMIILFAIGLSQRQKWFSSVPMAVTLISSIIILGITGMPSAWPFVLVYLLILLSLGAVIVRRMIPFRIKDYAFYLNHIGLWLLLFAAGMGASDVRNYVMNVREGETERHAYNEKGDIIELPISIELNDFYMEEYPPQLALIDRKTGAAQPENKPCYFPIDEKQKEGKIGDWHILLKEYIHEAVRNRDSTGLKPTTYREVRMPGASPAAWIEVRNPKTGATKEGWVCAGNIAQSYMVLNLDEQYYIAATRPEPKRFVSDVNVYAENGSREQTLLEVNKPYKSGHWMLYQYGYDNEAGNMSVYSSIELVYDPWLTPVYIGIILLACGSVCMLWSGNKRKEEVSDDVE